MFEIPVFIAEWFAVTTGSALTSVPQANAWQTGVVVAYFAVMLVLSLYGWHRYHLVYLYYKHREKAAPAPRTRFRTLPRVTVQLPIYNERYVVEDLLASVCRLDYPHDRLQIQVLDDSTDQTGAVARACAERWAARGYPVEYIRRANRHGFKAGALQAGLARARGEFIAVFDADFRPSPDFLGKTIHYFTDPEVGVVQGRWTFQNRDHSLLTRVQAVLLDGHFVFEHGARARSGRFFNFNGTAGVLRRAMIDDAGGWQHDTLTEDTDLSYRAQLRGWRFVYLPHVEVPSELPTDLLSFQVQQARWAKGLIETGRKVLPRLLRAELPTPVKVEAVFHLTANLSYPLMVVLSILLLPAMVLRYYHWPAVFLLADVPLFLGTFGSLSTFYVLSQKELFSQRWRECVTLMPLLLAVGIGLTITNCRAVLEGLLGFRSPFQRTAKYSDDEQRARLARRTYRVRSGWLPITNFLVGAYFTGCALYSLLIGNWFTLPFLLLFVVGYCFTAGVMVYQSCEQQIADVLAGGSAASSVVGSYLLRNGHSGPAARTAAKLLVSRSVAVDDR